MKLPKFPSAFVLMALSLILLVVLGCILWINGQYGIKEHLTSKDPKALRVLFVGNSLTYGADTPGKLAQILKSVRPVEAFSIKSFTWPGLRIEDHLKREEVKELLKEHWDFILLQPDSLAAFRGTDSLSKALSDFEAAIARESAHPIIVMTFADKGFFADQCTISQTYRYVGQNHRLKVMPVGDLYFYMQERHPEINLYADDGHHPSEAGGWVYATVVYLELFSKTGTKKVSDHASTKLELARLVEREYDLWQKIKDSRPEFSEASPDFSTDLSALWAQNGRVSDAERLSRRRLLYICRMFPAHDTSAYAYALKCLADTEYQSNGQAKKQEARRNYELARQVYLHLKEPDTEKISAIDSALMLEPNRIEMKRVENLLTEPPSDNIAKNGAAYLEIERAIRAEQKAEASEFGDKAITRSEAVEQARHKVREMLVRIPSTNRNDLIASLNRDLKHDNIKVVFDKITGNLWVARYAGGKYEIQFPVSWRRNVEDTGTKRGLEVIRANGD
jgi:hypothetical protein